MPFVFIHGVNVRVGSDPDPFANIHMMLRRYVAPVFAPERPYEVVCFDAIWGDLGASFAWAGASLPDPGKGAMGTAATATPSVDATSKVLVSDASVLRSSAQRLLGPTGGPRSTPLPPITMDIDDASDLFAAGVAASGSQTLLGPQQPKPHLESQALSAIAIDEALRARSVDGRVTLDDPSLAAIQADAQKRLATVATVDHTVSQGAQSTAMGVVQDAFAVVKDGLQKARDSAGESTAKALFGIRKPLNRLATTFAGDVFAYFDKRDQLEAPNSIVRRVTDALLAAQKVAILKNEPLVVLTHSMGGQILYDVVTYYLDRLGIDIKVDFWAAAASQVGLFEEMKRFKVSSPHFSLASNNKAPSPLGRHLRYWWNVHDSSDFISYTAAPIFEGVDDVLFMSDTSPAQAHGAYLVLPRFYRLLAEEVQAMLSRGST